jgi:hypothetical protein
MNSHNYQELRLKIFVFDRNTEFEGTV